MAATLEVRVPFLNFEIMELAARMPPEFKLRGLKRKYMLKRSAERLLPKTSFGGKKRALVRPSVPGFGARFAPMVDDLLSEETIRRRGLFNPAEVSRIISANLSDVRTTIFRYTTVNAGNVAA